MSKIEKFEDIVAWQKALELCDLLYFYTNNGTFAKDYGLRDQIRQASVSIVSNIAEGFERESNNQFTYFLTISKASAAEARAQLYVARNQNYISLEVFTLLNDKVIEISKIINNKEIKGSFS